MARVARFDDPRFSCKALYFNFLKIASSKEILWIRSGEVVRRSQHVLLESV